MPESENNSLLQAAKAARAELAAMHGYLYPACDGGCPADAILRQLAAAIAQAEQDSAPPKEKNQCDTKN